MRCKASCFGPQIGERRSLLVIALVLASIAPLMRAWCLMLSNERERRTVHGGGLVHIRDQTHRASGRGWHRAIGRRRRRLLRQRARRNHQRSLHEDKMLENFESHSSSYIIATRQSKLARSLRVPQAHHGAAADAAGNRTIRRKCPTSLRLLQLPNIAKTAISITKAVPTTANMKYISLGEDGATFIAMPRAIPNQLSYGGDPKGN